MKIISDNKDTLLSAARLAMDKNDYTMATLKISDLSVGDWVGIDQAELNMPSDDIATAYIEKLCKPIRIKGISEDSDTVLADIESVDGWGSIMLKCEYLRPIPITPVGRFVRRVGCDARWLPLRVGKVLRWLGSKWRYGIDI